MSTGKPGDVDRDAIAENAQRTVERTALRKVRKTLNGIERAAAEQRKQLRRVLIACAVLALVGALFAWGLFFAGREGPKGPAIELPAASEGKP
jgi:hypothetical protein